MTAPPPSSLRRARVSEVMLATFIGLIFMALVEGALVAILLAIAEPKSTSALFGFIFVWALFAFLFGLVPALLLGAPAYLALDRYGRANYATMLLIGVIFAAPLLLLTQESEPPFAVTLLSAPTVVALSTHWFVLWFVRQREGGGQSLAGTGSCPND